MMLDRDSLKKRLTDPGWMARRLLFLVVAVFLVTWALMPLLWSLSASFKGTMAVYENRANLIPRNPTIQKYIDVFEFKGFGRYAFNSGVLAVSSTGLAMFVSVLAAYAFYRYAFKWRHILLLAILIPRIIPRASLIVPLYQLIEGLGLLNTYTALIVTYTSTAIPLGTWILIGFFGNVPPEIEDSAEIDGASVWQRIWRVIVPLALPGMVTVGVLSFRQAWNEFPFVLAFTTSQEMRTLPYQLFLLRDTMGIQDWPLINAFTIVTILPIVILYMLFERRIVSSLTSGSLK
jgi:ABC-type glycerol-3-phosphate transport system permease component